MFYSSLHINPAHILLDFYVCVFFFLGECAILNGIFKNFSILNFNCSLVVYGKEIDFYVY